jgi:hypothetical protein
VKGVLAVLFSESVDSPFYWANGCLSLTILPRQCKQPSGAAVHSTVLAFHASSYVSAPWHWLLLSWQKMLAKLRLRMLSQG